MKKRINTEDSNEFTEEQSVKKNLTPAVYCQRPWEIKTGLGKG